MNLTNLNMMLSNRVGNNVISKIEIKDFFKDNKELIFKKKETVLTKEIFFNLFDRCLESKNLENVNYLLEDISTVIRTAFKKEEQKIKEKYGEELLDISNYSYSNYGSFKGRFEIMYKVSDNNEIFSLFLDEEFKKNANIVLEENFIIVYIGNYKLKFNTSNYEHKHNLGNIKRKLLRNNYSVLKAIYYISKLLK